MQLYLLLENEETGQRCIHSIPQGNDVNETVMKDFILDKMINFAGDLLDGRWLQDHRLYDLVTICKYNGQQEELGCKQWCTRDCIDPPALALISGDDGDEFAAALDEMLSHIVSYVFELESDIQVYDPDDMDDILTYYDIQTY